MKSVCFFNNKGGVGKTTLLANVASVLATRHSLRVLVVDADPQCNATQLILGEGRVRAIYKPSTHQGKKSARGPATLYDVLRPIAIGESRIVPPSPLIDSKENLFGVDLLPGHPNVALLEDKLSQAWLELSGGDIGGARQTNWSTQLCAALDSSYDIALFDVGPSLGALNRSVLLGCQYFVTPMGCDVFSLLGITNIAQWLLAWFGRYERSIEACKKAGFAAELKEFNIKDDIVEASRFIGYTVQQYIAKSKKGGARRPTVAYERIRKQIPGTIREELLKFMAPHLKEGMLELPAVPHMYSLVPLAQTSACPIHRLSYSEGLAGTQPQQKEKYTEFIQTLAVAILANAGIVRGVV